MLPVSVGGKGLDARHAHEVLASYVDPESVTESVLLTLK
jgi:hypothetical protein